MRTASYRVSDLQKFVIPIGFVGENEHCQIIFLAEDAYAEYPHAAASLTVRPPYGEPYPAVVTRDGNNVLWTVKDSDLTRSGQGEIQLSFTTGGIVAKTYVGKTKICRSIQPTGDVPDPIEDFLTEAGAALTAIPETIDAAFDAITAEAETLEAGESATASFDSETKVLTIGVPAGADGDPGQPGADGYSPTITVTDITGGHRLTITDKNGTRTVDVMDGEDGRPGAPGFSPVITVTDITGGHRLTITTATGTQTVDVMDGAGGDPTTLIDDTAGAGVVNKTWSANKLNTETSALLSAINVLPQIKDSTETGIDLDISDSSGNVIARLKDGHIQTKNFNSEENAGIKNSTETGVDLDVSDPSGNVLFRLQNGHIQTKNFDSSNAGNMICYVSPNGSDSASGDSSHPFLTIQHAVDNGYNRIMLAPGEYKNQKVTISGKHGISIICNTNQKENNIFESHKRQARAKLDNSIDVTGLTAYNSIYKTALSVDTDSSYYKVFVSQDVDPVYSGSDYYGRVTTYNAILWEITDDILTCTRLVPKLTLVECEATQGTFFYDGTDLYINPTSGSIEGVSYKRLNDDTFTSVTRGFYINNSTDIYIEGLDIQFFPYYDFHAAIVSGLLMRDCGFYFTCYGSAAEFQYCNGDLWECNAAKAGADGFGIAAGGNTSFYNCNAVYCYDDGISHHDEATGIIDGGIWTYCKKGGVTPSYGSHVTVKNVIATHNVYGIYFPQSGERVTDRVQYMQNCLAVDNTTKDVKVTGYDVVAYGCSYGTKEVDTGATLTEYNCTVIS